MNSYEPIINLLVQIPLVGIFIWFILEWSKRIDKSQLERDNKWREFLNEERLLRNQSIKTMANEIHNNTTTLSDIMDAFTAYEAKTRPNSHQLSNKK